MIKLSFITTSTNVRSLPPLHLCLLPMNPNPALGPSGLSFVPSVKVKISPPQNKFESTPLPRPTSGYLLMPYYAT